MSFGVKIRDYLYEVIFVDKEDERLNDGGEDYRLGMCHFINQQIVIADNLNNTRVKKVLIHELTHAFMEAYGFHAHREEFSAEDICEFVSVYGYEILDMATSVMGRKKSNG